MKIKYITLLLVALAGAPCQAAAGNPRADQRLVEAARDLSFNGMLAALEQGANPNAVDEMSGYTPLIITSMLGVSMGRTGRTYAPATTSDFCYMGDSDEEQEEQNNLDNEAIQMLIDRGANVNFSSKKSGTTALIVATAMGRLGSVKKLLDRGAHINATDENGETALMWAAKNDYGEIVQLLLNRQADISITNHAGQTALDMAQPNARPMLLTAQRQRQAATVQSTPPAALRRQPTSETSTIQRTQISTPGPTHTEASPPYALVPPRDTDPTPPYTELAPPYTEPAPRFKIGEAVRITINGDQKIGVVKGFVIEGSTFKYTVDIGPEDRNFTEPEMSSASEPRPAPISAPAPRPTEPGHPYTATAPLNTEPAPPYVETLAAQPGPSEMEVRHLRFDF